MDTLVRRPRVTLWLLRTVLTVHLVAVLAQPVLAGRYLVGDVDAIAVHGAIGTAALGAIGLATIATALAYVVVGRGRAWVLLVAVVMFGAVVTQIGAGYARDLALHVPLGVAMVVVAVLLSVWVWSPSAGRSR